MIPRSGQDADRHAARTASVGKSWSARPNWAKGYLKKHDKIVRHWLQLLGKVARTCTGSSIWKRWRRAATRINASGSGSHYGEAGGEDHRRVLGAITEGDGNFNMFRFLEREGAQVIVEPMATWVAYMLCQAQGARAEQKRIRKHPSAIANGTNSRATRQARWRYEEDSRLHGRRAMWTHFYHRVIKQLGGIAHQLVPQRELARLAEPFYHRLRAAAKDISKSARTSITRCTTYATWFWR